jgi:two-component system, cell cycle response regulator
MTARVLVVDDQPANVALLEAYLTSEYYEVLTARDGEEALKLARAERPDIILLDIMMPGIDGYEVCRRVKSDPVLATIPIIMVSALSDKADLVRGLEVGAEDFLTKPVDYTILSARVRSLVRLKMTQDEWRLKGETSDQLGLAEMPDDKDLEKGGKIFLVEQPGPAAERLKQNLNEAGYECTLAPEPAKAAELAGEGAFDLVVISLALSGIDALRMCSSMRTQPSTRQMPLLLIVDEERTVPLARGLEIGVNDYLVRPVHKAELLARVRSQIRRKRFQDRLRDFYRKSVTLSATDALTGLHNRRFLDAHLDATLRRAAEDDKPTTFVMIDIDHFKSVNDTYGHAVGDEVLKAVGERMQRSLRGSDTLSRMGGEEFGAILNNADSSSSLPVAERLRQIVSATPIKISHEKGEVTVTVSLGMATAKPGELGVLELVRRADDALYASKRSGRNKVTVAGQRVAAA